MSDKSRVHNHNFVFILGAGASVDAGMPVVANFLNRMRDSVEWLEEKCRDRELHAVQEVLRFRHEVAAAAYRVQTDPENIEELFSLAAATGGSLTDDVNLAIAATLDYSRARIESQTRVAKLFVQRNLPGWEPPRVWQECIRAETAPGIAKAVANLGPAAPQAEIDRPVVELIYAFITATVWPHDPRRHITIVTFNYDLVVETALDTLGVPWSYGTLSINDDDPPQAAGGITLLKLHGSMNWHRPRTSSGEPGKTLETSSTYEALISAGGVPYLIPPTWQKNFSDYMALVWSDAINALSEATCVGILGFSLPATDTHFKYLLAAGLRNNISLRRLAFATKNAQGPIKRLLEILRPELAPSLVTTQDIDMMSFAFNDSLQTLFGMGPPAAAVSVPASVRAG